MRWFARITSLGIAIGYAMVLFFIDRWLGSISPAEWVIGLGFGGGLALSIQGVIRALGPEEATREITPDISPEASGPGSEDIGWVVNFVRVIGSAETPALVCGAALEHLAESEGLVRGVVYRFDDGTLVVQARIGVGSDEETRIATLGEEGIVSWTARTQTRFWGPRPPEDPEAITLLDRAPPSPHACVPLTMGARCLGVLLLDDVEEGESHLVSAEHVVALAGLLAIRLKNVAILEELRYQVEQSQSTSTPDPDLVST